MFMNMLSKMCLFIQVPPSVHDLWTSVQGEVPYESGLVQPIRSQHKIAETAHFFALFFLHKVRQSQCKKSD